MSTKGRQFLVEKPVFPPSIDPKLLKQFYQQMQDDRRDRLQAEYEAFLRKAKEQDQATNATLDLFDFDRKRLESLANEQRKAIESAAEEGPDAPLDGPNPTRFAPFDGGGAFNSSGGLVGVEFRGPDVRTGLTGAHMFTVGAGHAFRSVEVGYFFTSPATATRNITLQATVAGLAACSSILFGYCQAYAGLRLVVTQFNPFRTFVNETRIYQHSGILALSLEPFPSTLRSVSMVVPMLRDTLYFIGGGAVQNVFAGGFSVARSSFRMIVSPIICA